MRHIFLDKEAMVMKEAAQPFLDDHMILISIHSVFIRSGADLPSLEHASQEQARNVPQRVKKMLELVAASSYKKYRKKRGAFSLRSGPGHTSHATLSCSGRIIATGKKVRKVAVGDWVACVYETDDVLSQVICVSEATVVRITGEQYARSASIVAVGVTALRSIRRARLGLSDRICVVGLGVMGQLLVQLAKIAGCVVIGVESDASRIALAKKLSQQVSPHLAADRMYNFQEDDIAQEIALATQQQSLDALFITAEMHPSFLENHAPESLIRAKGRLIVVDPVEIDLACASLYKKEIDMAFSSSITGNEHDEWTPLRAMHAFINLIEAKKINIEALLAGDVHDAALPITISMMAGMSADTLISYKNVAHTLASSAETASPEVRPFACDTANPISFNTRFNPAVRDTIRLGFVGVGDFSARKLLPLVASIKNARIAALFDVNMAHAIQASKNYGAAKVHTREQELFACDTIDAVIIASPHTYHTEQVLHALQQGKAVFLENPMATTQEQLQQIRLFLSCYAQAPFCVDYNRSFSPFIKKIKAVVEKRIAPLMITYRMNVGFIPKENWIQTEVGAGRIIGEASHIIDLFCLLTNAKPVSISVETMHAARDDLFPTDNFSAQIRFDDGSLCILVYTAVGHGNLGKERMEVFVDGKTMVLDDYVRLVGFGVPSWFNETVLARDKGHEALLQAFLDSLRQPTFTPPISFERLCLVAELSLLIDQLACQGGGFKEW